MDDDSVVPKSGSEKYLNPEWVKFCAEHGISTNEVITNELKTKFDEWKSRKSEG